VDRSAAVKKKAQQLVQKGDVPGAIAEYEKLFEGGDKDPYDFIVVADLLANIPSTIAFKFGKASFLASLRRISSTKSNDVSLSLLGGLPPERQLLPLQL